MSSKPALQAIVKLGENLPIARKRRGLLIVDLARKDLSGLKGEVQRLPQRVRRGLLPVERVSAAEFWNEKRRGRLRPTVAC